MRNPFKRQIHEIKDIAIDYKPSVYTDKSVIKKLDERFKGEVEQKKVKFPTDLGEEHPFDFKVLEELYKKFGFFTAVVDKYIDFIVGPGFYIKCDDERAKKIIDDFIQDVNFDTLLRAWAKEALVKGNGFLEIGESKEKGVEGLKILNANYMYVVRDEKGNKIGYNQYVGAFNKFDKRKVIPFKDPNFIAHIPFNLIGDCAYGLGIGYTAMKLIDDWLSQQKSLHQLMDRKANSPLHAQFGYINGDTKIIPKPEDVQALGKDIEMMSNKTNWVTDPLVNFKVVDFGNFGDKFATILENDLEMLIYAFQIPAVLLGKANVAEGLAKVQMEAFQRRIQSIQAELEKIIEQQIFKKVLIANGLEVHVEFEWGTPSVMETEGRISIISSLLQSMNVSKSMKEILENEMVNLLKLDKDKWEELKLAQQGKEDEEIKRLQAEPQPRVPGQNDKFPQPVQPKKDQPKQPKPEEKVKVPEIKEIDKVESVKIKQPLKIKRTKEQKNYEGIKQCAHCDESYDKYNQIEEWLGFNYKTYLRQILESVGLYDFDQIRAITELELEAGYLSSTQINEFKKILNDGFTKGASMTEMSKVVDKKLALKDLYRMTEDGNIKLGASGLPILARSADKRAMGIVRTEVTRLSSIGAVKYYKENNIKMIKHVASYGKRTCIQCESLNNIIYEIGQEPGLPVHPGCRCMYVAVEEIK